jgi:hypothetical protein
VDRHGDEYERKLTTKWIGNVIRRKLARESKCWLRHPAGGVTQGRSTLRALRNSVGNGRNSADRRASGAGLSMNVVYVVYIARRGFTPLTQENQGLKKRGTPQILFLHTRYQRSQRTQRSFHKQIESAHSGRQYLRSRWTLAKPKRTATCWATS